MAFTFLIPASLIFYAYWNPPFVLLLIVTKVANFLWSKHLHRSTGRRKILLIAGIAGNLIPLLYFKYSGFFIESLNAVAETEFGTADIFLPLGISFFTFQNVAYLIDIYQRRIAPVSFRDYVLFISFFPQLIAGPIVHAQEFVPQILAFKGREQFWQNMATGSSLFIMGLFKKVVLADSLSRFSTPVFTLAAAGSPISFFDGWTGALSYTFQLYFDFSGYSDMALGLALMFGFRLPINFLSPYKSTDIGQFWRTWHMTLSRFFRDYLYIPLGGNRVPPLRQVTNLILTMFLAGLWHGAGWTFVIWGLLHGVYLVLHRLFVYARLALLPSLNTRTAGYRLISHFLTFTAIVVGWVFFRAENFNSAFSILRAMSGVDGILVPERVFGFFIDSGDTWLRFPEEGEKWISTSYWSIPWIGVSYMICMLLPASASYFGIGDNQNTSRLKFRMIWTTAILITLMAMASLFNMQRISEFLYFQF